MANTGIKTVLTLRKYVDGVATSEVKINDPADPDYIAPYEDLVDCPVSGGVTPTTATPTTQAPTTAGPTTAAPTTAAPTTAAPTTAAPTTAGPTTAAPTTAAPTTAAPTTAAPTTAGPTTAAPTTAAPTTSGPTTAAPTTAGPTTAAPTTAGPTTAAPTTAAPTTAAPTTEAPSSYNYYFIRECFDGAISGGGGDGTNGDAVIRTVNDLSGWSHILIPRFSGDVGGISEIYNVTNQAAYDDVNSSDYGPIDVDTISGVAQKTSCSGGATTVAPTTQAPSGDCTTYLLQNTSGIGTVGFSFNGCGPDLGRNGTSVTNDGYEYVCSSTVPTSSDANASIEALGDCGTVATTAPPTTAAPVVLTQFNTTSTASGNFTDACGLAPGTSRWHDGDGPDPVDGDIVYLTSDSNGATIGAGYWKLNFGWIQTNTAGLVILTGLCP